MAQAPRWNFATSSTAASATGAPVVQTPPLVMNPRPAATATTQPAPVPTPSPTPAAKPTPAASPAPQKAATAPTAPAPTAPPASAAPVEPTPATPPLPPPSGAAPQGSPKTIEEAVAQFQKTWGDSKNEWTGLFENLAKSYPDTAKMWEDFYSKAAARPTTQPMNPMLAFAAAMGAPEMTAKTVMDRNQSIMSERARREQELLEIKRMALQGTIDKAMRNGDFQKAILQLDMLKQADAQLEVLKGNIDLIKGHQTGVETRESIRVRGDEAMRVARLKMEQAAKTLGGKYAKEIQNIMAKVEQNRSSGGIVLASPEEVYREVAAQFNLSHKADDVQMSADGNIYHPSTYGTGTPQTGQADLSQYSLSDLKGFLNKPEYAPYKDVIQSRIAVMEDENKQDMIAGRPARHK